MSLTTREVALAIIPKVTGGLSMLGSGTIGWLVLADPKKRCKTYHRLVMVMSLCDFVSSFCFFLSTWPLPQGENKGWKSPYHYQAVGNQATCAAQGFGIQFGITATFFNFMLALHFLLVIRYNYTEKAVRTVEPFMWGIALALGVGLSVPGLFLHIYNNSNLWCWIANNWTLCNELGLTRDECVARTYSFRWAFYYGPLWTCIGVVVLAQGFLWWTVRQMEVKADRWRFPSATNKTSENKALRLKQSRRVAVQACWYMAVFVITWVPYTAIAMTGRYFNPHNTGGFIALLTVVICQPSQGFLNLIVYHRASLAKASFRAASSLSQSLKQNFQKMSRFSNSSQTTKQQQDLNRIRNELIDTRLTTTELDVDGKSGAEIEHIDMSVVPTAENALEHEDQHDDYDVLAPDIKGVEKSETSDGDEDLHDIYD